MIVTNGDFVRVQWKRPDDGKVWKQDCRIDGNKVIWRAVDAFGAGSGEGRWRTDEADERITFKLNDNSVDLTVGYGPEPGDTETFKI